MSIFKSNDDFDSALKKNGFLRDENDNLKYNANDGIWDYHVYYEGYAYVLYKNYRGQEIPIAEFRDAFKFDVLYNLITTYVED